MAAAPIRRLAVPTCIACGARYRAGECEDGCSDVPLDLVEEAELDRLTDRVAALRARVGALRGLAEALAAGEDAAALRERARSASRLPLPDVAPAAEIVQAWGCPRCGRVDAPQPCLGVCVRQPVEMADAGEYRALLSEHDRLARADRALGALALLVARVVPRAGQAGSTGQALRSRALAALDS